MTKSNWRNIAELVGVVGIMASLLLVASEIRLANHIAKAQIVLELASQYNQFNSSRFQNPDVANLALALTDSTDPSISDSQRSMMAGAAWHFANIMWSAQVAYDNELLSEHDLDKYRSDLVWMLERMPGLRSEFVLIYETMPSVRDAHVFEPIASYTDKPQ